MPHSCLRGATQPYTVYHLRIPYSATFWRGKTLANLANRTPFANILPRQIPDSLK